MLLSAADAAEPPRVDGNRHAQLEGCNPYWPGLGAPRLVTPQWVGEPGVEAVVVLAIDDMRGPEKWEAYLRPLIDRLKRVDGRAPISIMTCDVDPAHRQLQAWQAEGLQFDVHTIDHPCPLLKDGDLPKARSTYERCVDLLARVPGNQPVAFRMPCCDSLNTLSPRFFTEIFQRRTAAGQFLELDSSVFMQLTPDDPALERALTTLPDGSERFRRYVPFRNFANQIENYPYPYVIDRTCWEFPCIVPSDWQAQHVQQPANPRTVADLCAALDAVVVKQGVFDLVFHPYGWIRAEQVAELVDYAQRVYGPRVKFLNFREARDRLTEHLLAGTPLRRPRETGGELAGGELAGGELAGGDHGARVLDVNLDGWMDVVIGNEQTQRTRVWLPERQAWQETPTPTPLCLATASGVHGRHAAWGVLEGATVLCVRDEHGAGAWKFTEGTWRPIEPFWDDVQAGGAPMLTSHEGRDRGLRLVDLDGDGASELLVANDAQQAVFRWDRETARWHATGWAWPEGVALVDAAGADCGLRLVDVDEDGGLDLLFSNEARYSLHLFADATQGWSIEALAAERPVGDAIPPLVRHGTNNGAWLLNRALWVQNEDTAKLPDLVDRRPFHNLLAGVTPRGRTAEQAARTMRARPGFVVEQVAAEPLVADPVAFDWDAQGRLWVVEMADYPQGVEGQPAGRVRLLSDDDGDGRYDRANVLADGLSYPNSIKTWRGGALVVSAPEILYLEDRDGDGRAEIREPLYTGFAKANPQHRTCGFAYGLDNWLYCGNGSGSIRSVKTGAEVELFGRDYRLRPDEGLLDPQAGHTQYLRAMDDWGNWFGNNNIEPLFQFVLSDHYQRRNPHFAPPDDGRPVPEQSGSAPVFPLSRTLDRFNDLHTANRFTSACGTTIYRDDLFGPGFEGNSFAPEPVHNLVHREVLKRDGLWHGSRRAVDEERGEFLATSDNWSRPTSARTGPDGALWVADMVRAVIEHPEWIGPERLAGLDVRAGSDLGRIYRVYPVGTRPRPIPALGALDAAGLAAALDHPSGWQRDKAQELLVERQDARAVAPLRELLRQSKRPQARLHALGALEGLHALDEADVVVGLGDAHFGVRRLAVRLSVPFVATSSAIADRWAQLVDDPDPWVRLQLAYSLGEWDDSRAGQCLARLARRDAAEPYLVAAMMSSVLPRLPEVVDALIAGGPVEGPLAGVVQHLIDTSLAAENDDALASLLAAVVTPQGTGLAPWQVAAYARLVEGGQQRPMTWQRVSERLRHDRPQLVEQLAALRGEARRVARDAEAPLELRLPALQLLGREADERGDDLEQLAALLAPQTPTELQEAALAALERLGGDDVPPRLLAHWRGAAPALRERLLGLLLARENWTGTLLDAVAAGDLQAAELPAAARQRLLEHRRRALRERAQELLASATGAGRAEVVRQFHDVLSLPGDATRGGELFAKKCGVCHRFRDAGTAVGPDLSAVTDKSPEALLVAVLDPNRAVESRFLSYTAATLDGLTHTGLLAAETSTSVTLVEQQGKQHVLLRGQLEALETAGRSLMPEGLERELSRQDLADVMAYVLAHAPRAKTFPGNRPQKVVPDPLRREFACLPANASIFGDTLILEELHGNLGYWTSENDVAIWELEVERAGSYEVILEWACPESTAGNPFLLEIGDQRLGGQVESTGDWQDYRRKSIGRARLAAGTVRVGLRGNGPIQNALFDVKSITLRPRGD